MPLESLGYSHNPQRSRTGWSIIYWYELFYGVTVSIIPSNSPFKRAGRTTVLDLSALCSLLLFTTSEDNITFMCLDFDHINTRNYFPTNS